MFYFGIALMFFGGAFVAMSLTGKDTKELVIPSVMVTAVGLFILLEVTVRVKEELTTTENTKVIRLSDDQYCMPVSTAVKVMK